MAALTADSSSHLPFHPTLKRRHPSLKRAGGYREHDILVIGQDSAENITKFGYGPEHNIIEA
ncbi:hypothetical protein [Arthrobacter silvisoli]|uniref:hypothetical protein n=1 Tax=Arthrobacter silvisoli TaxID=2291022 RepID=UPI000E2112F9|nr:hypothetical protein [Arthrobacter silvisoli]